MDKTISMDQARYINELLFDHDCVIIPGFGGFIGNYAPARIQTLRHEFFPPSKSLLFNPNLKQNDGLLAVAISKGENIRYDDALLAVNSLVKRWNRELGAGLTVEIEGVGRIYRDQEGNIQFDQNREVNFLADSYGLSSFISPVISRREPVVEETKEFLQQAETRGENPYFIPKVLKWAAFLALPLGTAALLGITQIDKFRDFSVAYSGMLFSSTAVEASKPVPTTKTKDFPAKTAEKPQTVSKETTRIIPLQVKETSEKPFMIIVGAFRFLENAESLLASLKSKGYDATMAGQTKSGLYRVSLISCSDRNEAVRQLEIVRSGEFMSAWLLVK